MRVGNISFGSERPIYCVRVLQEDGSEKEVHMTESEVKVYHAEQGIIKEGKRKEEALKNQQEGWALIGKTQTTQKEKG